MFLVGKGDATGVGRFNGLLPTGRGEGDVVLVVVVGKDLVVVVVVVVGVGSGLLLTGGGALGGTEGCGGSLFALLVLVLLLLWLLWMLWPAVFLAEFGTAFVLTVEGRLVAGEGGFKRGRFGMEDTRAASPGTGRLRVP